MRIFFSLLTCFAVNNVAHSAKREWIRVSDDGKSFVQEPSGKEFVPWGFNYDHDRDGRLLEDYWIDEWATVAEDFREMKELGANVVRIHLQFGRFMNSPTEPNEQSLERLDKLVQLADDTGLYLDLTGLACYHKRDVPEWYDVLDEQARWDAQARFWKAIAQRCAGRPAVFFYDLMNEPTVPGDRKQTEWLAAQFAGKYFVQRIALDSRGRPKHEVAKAWIDRLVGAIREHDEKHLITVGMLPDPRSGFVPAKVGENLDFFAVHVYPKRDKPEEALKTVQSFQLGKPLIVEEIYPLAAGSDDVVRFIEDSRPYVSGWISFYWGETPEELRASDKPGSNHQLDWLKAFQRKGKTIRRIEQP